MSDSPPGHEPRPENESGLARTIGLLAVRFGIGAVMVAGGIATLVISPAGLGVDGFAMAAGGGVSVILINLMYRLSVTGEQDREREERARVYLDEHGEWPPDEQPLEPRARRSVPSPPASSHTTSHDGKAESEVVDRAEPSHR